MKNKKYRRKRAVLLAVVMAVNLCVPAVTPLRNTYAYTERSATVYATSLNVRSGPGTGYPVVAKLVHGAAVTVTGEQNGADGVLWYQIRCTGADGASATGFVSSSFLRFTVEYTNDGNFEAYLVSQGFPESYKPGLRQLHAKYPNWVFKAQQTGLDWNTVIQNESLLGRNLVHKSSVSSWKSTAAGAYNWDTSSWPGFDGSSWVAASEDIIRYYMDPRNFLDEMNVFQFLLQSYNSSSHTSEGLKLMVKGTFLDGSSSDGSGGNGGSNSPISGGDGGGGTPGGQTGGGSGPASGGSGPDSGYVNAGPGASLSGGAASGTSGGPDGTGNSQAGSSGSYEKPSLEGPPQASLSRHETDVLATSYGPGVTGPGAAPEVQTGGTAPSSGSSSYIDIIMNAGIQSGVNPYVLAAMIIQEQGSAGSSNSISGREPGYEGYYNFFNIEAYASNNMSAVTRGVWWASQSGSYGRPWNTVEKSIIGGAEYYGTNYVKAGQDTFYLKKFNVQGSNLYKHQYMTNVQGAASEGAVYAKAYSDEMKQTALEFKIPVFNNMPDTPAPKPSMDGSPNNKLSYLEVSGFSLTPTFNREVLEYDLIVDPSVSNVTINAAAIDSSASLSGTGNIALQSGNNTIKITVKAQNGAIREYILHVVRQNNGPTYSGASGGASGAPGGAQDGSGPSPGGGAAGPGGESAAQSPAQGGGDAGSTPGGNEVTVVP